MTREIDLASYLPPFMAEVREISGVLETENPELMLVWKAADRGLQNAFIETADEYGLARFERILGILPSAEDTLESRRARLSVRWFDAIPYTWKVLIKKLEVLCEGSDFVLQGNFTDGYTLTLHTHLDAYGKTEEIREIIETVLPCNIAVISDNSISCNATGNVGLGGSVGFTTMITVSERG